MQASLLVALTGGPCGGKTSLIQSARTRCLIDIPYFMLPEAAPLVLGAGIDFRDKSFQLAVVRVQMALEEVFLNQRAGTIVLCHRGTMDALAYWTRNGWNAEEFFTATGMSKQQHLSRYHAVLHLETAASGAEDSYKRQPYAHRPETKDQARELDRRCREAWCRHDRYSFIGNNGRDWPTKLREAEEWLRNATIECQDGRWGNR
jgi:hypothetical protein